MRMSLWVIGMGACLFGLTGCASGPRTTMFSVAGDLEKVDAAKFGVADWLRNVDTVETTALVTSYDAEGTAYPTIQYLRINPRGKWITARCNLPGGSWTARVYLDDWSVTNPIGIGWVSDHGDVQLTDEQEEEIACTLRLILHRVCGPVNLLGGGEKVTAADQVFATGYEMTRFRVKGRPSLARAYFFGDAADQLRLVTQGGWQPTDAGTVTVYRNMRTPDGVVLPSELEVSNLGENSLIGRKKTLSVRLTNIKIQMRD